MPVTVRAFRRGDRDQLTALVNLHVGAVLPGTGLSTNVVLSQLEREPEDAIVDPWVAERRCLIAEVDDELVAATLLQRFDSDPSVPEGYRGAANLRWLLFNPMSEEAGRALFDAAIDQAQSWRPSQLFLDSVLPAPGCVGVPNVWPHIRNLIVDSGFTGPTRSELVLMADCEALVSTDRVATRRSVGALGTRLDLIDHGDRSLGYIEVCPAGPSLQRSSPSTTWADVGNLFAFDGVELEDVMPPLISAAASWLQMGGVERLIGYYAADVDPPEYLAMLSSLGFVDLVTNERGWALPLTS